MNEDSLYFLGRLYIFDAWLLAKSKRFLELIVEFLFPLLKFILIVALVAGILTACTYKQIKARHNKTHQINCDGSQLFCNYLGTNNDMNLGVHAKKKDVITTKNEKTFYMEDLNYQEKITNTGFADFASEIVGGVILSTPETQSYYKPTSNQITIFGIPLWKPRHHTPRKIIQPWRETGECWAFRGSHGKIEIELAHAVIIDRVTLEHIPKSLSLTGNISSAPKLFNLLGKVENNYVMIDTFMYKEDGMSSQIFQISKSELKTTPFKVIILEIVSNYGNPDYTCIYRFKVHGKINDLSSHKNNLCVH